MILATLPEIQLDAALVVADRRQPAAACGAGTRRQSGALPLAPAVGAWYSAPAEVAATIT